MPNLPSFRKLLSSVAALSLVCTLIASACPTCETDAHPPVVTAPTGCCDTRPLVNDWQTGAEGCACCESDGCTEAGELPDGLTSRPAPVAHAVVVLLPSSPILPGDVHGGLKPDGNADPPGRTKIHIRHQSFLC